MGLANIQNSYIDNDTDSNEKTRAGKRTRPKKGKSARTYQAKESGYEAYLYRLLMNLTL